VLTQLFHRGSYRAAGVSRVGDEDAAAGAECEIRSGLPRVGDAKAWLRVLDAAAQMGREVGDGAREKVRTRIRAEA
jgi:hypothetical protein